jgi:hypothetical protein
MPVRDAPQRDPCCTAKLKVGQAFTAGQAVARPGISQFLDMFD